MRFLCLHGRGTNCKVFQTQLGAVQYQLGDGHEFEFVEGILPAEAAPEIKTMAATDEKYFSYFDDVSPPSCLAALNDLERYVNLQGPFDGIMAFSQGTVLASTLLVRQAQQVGGRNRLKLAVFFSGAAAGDPDLLSQGVIKQLDPSEVGHVISIPTAHVWGNVENGELHGPTELLNLCLEEARETFQHDGGHEIPGTKDPGSVREIVRVIRRTIWRAERGARQG